MSQTPRVKAPPAPPAKRGRPRRPEPPSLESLAGRKHLAVLQKHRRRLRKANPHPNRVLLYDDVLTLHALAFFNPTLRSLRTIEDFSRVPQVAGLLNAPQVCRSTLSDAHAVFDPALLEPLIADLQARLPGLPRFDGRLSRLLGSLRLVDGSLFKVAADVQWALGRRKRYSADKTERFVRLDLQLCAATGTPVCVELNGRGCGETAAARRNIDPGVVYVADRGIFSFAYVREIIAAGADLVLRIKTSQYFLRQQALPLCEEDRAAGVVSDHLGELTGRGAGEECLREVVIDDPNNPGHVVRLLASLPAEIPAHVVGKVYRHRWQIELFFRWLKVFANFEHAISHNRNGLTLAFYVAVIGVLLIYLHSGRKPSKYAYNMLCLVAGGQADLADILPILEERERQSERDRKSQAKRKATKAAK